MPVEQVDTESLGDGLIVCGDGSEEDPQDEQ
jgi:hypothetical protein